MADILVVDAEKDSRKSTNYILHGAGYQINPVEGGREAVSRALLMQSHDRPADLLLTDWHMPEVDGMDMIVAMAYARCLPERVIVLSRDFVSPGKADVFSEKLRALVPKETKFNFLALAKPIPENQLLYAVVHMLEDRVE